MINDVGVMPPSPMMDISNVYEPLMGADAETIKVPIITGPADKFQKFLMRRKPLPGLPLKQLFSYLPPRSIFDPASRLAGNYGLDGKMHHLMYRKNQCLSWPWSTDSESLEWVVWAVHWIIWSVVCIQFLFSTVNFLWGAKNIRNTADGILWSMDFSFTLILDIFLLHAIKNCHVFFPFLWAAFFIFVYQTIRLPIYKFLRRRSSTVVGAKMNTKGPSLPKPSPEPGVSD